MTEQQELPEDEDEKKRPWLRILLLVLGMVLVAGVSVGLTLFLSGALDEQAANEGTAAQAAGDTKPKAQYMQLNPPFIVSFEEASTKRQRFLQVEMAVMSRRQETLDTLTQHMPRVRNNIIQALSDQTFSDVRTDAGREEVTTMVRNVLQEIVDEYGDDGTVERVLFRNFVLQ